LKPTQSESWHQAIVFGTSGVTKSGYINTCNLVKTSLRIIVEIIICVLFY